MRLAKPDARWRWMGRAAEAASRLLGDSGVIRASIFGDHCLDLSLADSYWVTPLLLGRDYEPGVRELLSVSLDPGTLFVDCGANLGWWSVYGSTYISDPSRIIAVEAASDTFARLNHTRSLNGRAFTALNRAVSDRDDIFMLVVSHGGHAGATVADRPNDGETWSDQVLTIRLETLIRLYDQPNRTRIVVKLDVEGSEERALRGCGPYLPGIDVIIYEEHGRTKASPVTSQLMQLGYSIVYCDDDNGSLRAVRSLADLRVIKANPRRGYNFAGVWNQSEVRRLVQSAVAAHLSARPGLGTRP